MKAMGRKMITRESVVARTARVISWVARMAAAKGGTVFSSMKRTMFSRTTIASSITIPTARVRARSVMLLRVKPITFRRVKVATIEVGMAREAMITERTSRMKSSTTRLARMLPKNRCSSRESMEALMKTDWSLITRSSTSRGRERWISARRFLIASMIRTVLVPAWRRTSRETASRPSRRFQVRGSA